MTEASIDEHYDFLRELAHRLLGHRGPAGLPDPTEVVHESFLRIERALGDRGLPPGEFRAYAVRTLRSVIVDALRSRPSRSPSGLRVSLSDVVPADDPATDVDLADLDAALERFRSIAPRAAQVVELRSFGGLGAEEVAVLLGVTRRTVTSDWAFARSWLHERLTRD